MDYRPGTRHRRTLGPGRREADRWDLKTGKEVARYEFSDADSDKKCSFLNDVAVDNDSGLVCCLLGIREPEQLRLHPLRGAIFESWVVAEVYKASAHSGLRPSLFHYRETRGIEMIRSHLVYGGDGAYQRSGAQVIPWHDAQRLIRR